METLKLKNTVINMWNSPDRLNSRFVMAGERNSPILTIERK